MRLRLYLFIITLSLIYPTFASNTNSNDKNNGYILYALEGDSFIGSTLNFFGLSKTKSNTKPSTSSKCPSGGFICMGTDGFCSTDSCFWSYCRKNPVMVDARLNGIISDSTRSDIYKLCTPKKKYSTKSYSRQYNVSGSGYYGSVDSTGSGYLYLDDGSEVFVYGQIGDNGQIEANDDNGNYYSLKID